MALIPTPFLKLQHPFTCTIAAPTKAGKTTFVSKLIRYADQMIYPSPSKIIWCYSEWQDAYEKLSTVEFYHGLPDIEELRENETPMLLAFDDLMTEVKKF